MPGFSAGFKEDVNQVKPWKIDDINKIQYNTNGRDKIIKILFNEEGRDALILRVPKRGEDHYNMSSQIAQTYHPFGWWKIFLSDGNESKLMENSELKREWTASRAASAVGRWFSELGKEAHRGGGRKRSKKKKISKKKYKKRKTKKRNTKRRTKKR